MGAENNTIGGTTPGAANVISGIADGAGVYITGTHIFYSGGAGQPVLTNSNTVEGNFIGTEETGAYRVDYPTSIGAESYPFSGDGIYLDEGTYNNTIGGLTAAARNIISGNLANGIEFESSAANNTVHGNYLGVDVTGSIALGHGYSGVEIASDSDNNVIGGTAAARQAMSFPETEQPAARIYGSNNNVVQGNHIGTDATGSIALGNIGRGCVNRSQFF